MKTLTSGDMNMFRGGGELPDLPKIANSDNSQLRSKLQIPGNNAALENTFLKAPP